VRFARAAMNALRNALYSTLRFIERHVTGFFGAVAAFATVGFLVAAAAISVFAALASAVNAGFTQRMDEAALVWFAHHRNAVLDQVALEVTTLGTGAVIILVVLVASVFLWQTQHKWSVYVLMLGTTGGIVLNMLLKGFFHRARPTVVEWGTTVHTASFPSGHAMESLVTYGCVAYLVGRLGPTSRLRHTTYGIATLLIAGIGASRLYLGVHYPSDVIAGYIAGLGWLAFVASTLQAVEFFAHRRPQTHAEEHDLHR
jgi:undecaprenyl-diphosphatase